MRRTADVEPTDDRTLVVELGEDGCATYSDMAKAVGVSVGTVRNRVTALREVQQIDGVIHVTSYLVTEIKFQSSINLARLMEPTSGTDDSRD